LFWNGTPTDPMVEIHIGMNSCEKKKRGWNDELSEALETGKKKKPWIPGRNPDNVSIPLMPMKVAWYPDKHNKLLFAPQVWQRSVAISS